MFVTFRIGAKPTLDLQKFLIIVKNLRYLGQRESSTFFIGELIVSTTPDLLFLVGLGTVPRRIRLTLLLVGV